MKKVLIISYYHPPCLGVAASRTGSWSDNFSENKIYPTVITRHWQGNENSWTDFISDSKAKEIKIAEDTEKKTIYLPYKQILLFKLTEHRLLRKLRLGSIIHFLLTLRGYFQIEVDGYFNFKKYVFSHLENNSYDLIMVSSPPVNLIRLAYEINLKFGIPYAVDFRDLWNNLLLSKTYQPDKKNQWMDFQKEKYISKWLKNVSFVTTVTPSISYHVKRIVNCKTEEITNGYEKFLYSNNNILPSSSFLKISMVGTIHPVQSIEVMLEGLNKFLHNKTGQQVQLFFIGLASYPEIAKKVREKLPFNIVHITPKVQKEEAVRHTLNSHILLFPSYSGFKDYFTTKIFEYIGAKRNILMVPGENGLVDQLINTTKAGKIVNSPDEMYKALELWLKEFNENKKLAYHGVDAVINTYSREELTAKLCYLIKSVLSEQK